MGIMEWNNDLSVRIKSIDEQHKKLIDLINSFYDNISQSSDKERMLKTIDGLKQYTIFHFSTEENYMKQFGYHDFASHKKEHDKFVEKVLDFETRYKSGRLLISIEITNFIKNWIANHIMQVDKGYSDFLIKNGVV